MAYQNKTPVAKAKTDGALWKTTATSGLVYLRGNIEVNGEKLWISVFKNTYKKGDGTDEKSPDYQIKLSPPDTKATPAQRNSPPRTGGKPAARRPAPVQEEAQEPDEPQEPAAGDDEIF